jgi:hypothetical protein
MTSFNCAAMSSPTRSGSPFLQSSVMAIRPHLSCELMTDQLNAEFSWLTHRRTEAGDPGRPGLKIFLRQLAGMGGYRP